MPNPQISRLRMLGLLFCLLGGTLITFGWMGTARVACVDCQMPYLLSGGAAGLGLIIIGVGLLVIAQLRAEGDKLAERLGALTAPADDAPDDPGVPAQRAATHDTEPIPLADTAGETDPPADPDLAGADSGGTTDSSDDASR